MISLTPTLRRIAYVVLYEALAILLATLLLAALSDGEARGNVVIAMAASMAAVVWNFAYNTLFEAWERRRGIATRSISIRLLHTAGFELGLVTILIPLFMWWYQIGPLAALAMEAALLLFFLVFTFAFTWAFDRVVKREAGVPRAASL